MGYAYGTQGAPAVGNGLGGLPKRATATQYREVWVATGSPVTIQTQYTNLVVGSTAPQICVLPDDGSIFMTYSNGDAYSHRTLKCTDSGFVNKYSEVNSSAAYAWAYAGSSQYSLVPVGPFVYTKNFGNSPAKVNTDTGVETNTLTWNANGTGFALTNHRSLAYDPVAGRGIGILFDNNNTVSAACTFDPSTDTTLSVSANQSNIYNGASGVVSGGKYYCVYQTGDSNSAIANVLTVNTDLTGLTTNSITAYQSGGAASTSVDNAPYRLTTSPTSNILRVVSGRIRTSSSPSTSGIYSGQNNKGPFGEINKNNLAQSFLGHETSPRSLCIGSDICVPVMNSSGALCWVNYYNGVPVEPVTGVTLRINANYGVTFEVGGTTIQMYKIVQQVVS